jgi:hypothetical protein
MEGWRKCAFITMAALVVTYAVTLCLWTPFCVERVLIAMLFAWQHG